MATKPGTKLPPSVPARFIALLLAADIAVIDLTAAIIYGTGLWITISTILVVVLFGALAVVVIMLVNQGRGAEMLFSFGRAAWITASALFWAVAAGLILVALGYGVAVALPAAAPLLLYALAFLAILLMTWSAANGVVRRRRMLLILNHIERAVRMDMPLPRMIQAAAQSETGVMRLRLIALHDHLDRGESLDQTLLYAVPEIPYKTLRMIAAGQQMGCLGHVLETIVRRRMDDRAPGSASVSFYWAYPVIIIAVVWLLLVAVIPKYEGIFRDFRIQLPPTTRALLSICNSSSGLWIVILLLTLVPLGRALSMIFASFRAVSPLSGIFAEHLVWWTPFIGGFVRDRGMADLCDIISAGVRTGHPLDESLHEAAEALPNAVMRYRAAAWARAVADGQTMHEAARYARMPDLFASMLATVRNNESLLQVLGFLWRHYEFRVSRTRAVIQALYVPVVVLVLGTAVGFVGASLMQPISMLSEHIAASISGGF